MEKVKKLKKNDDPRIGDKNIVPRDAQIIEQTLESFGITARIAEVNFRPKDTEFCLEIAMGTPLENITKLHKDIAMALASLTGDVEIEAPIPGKALVAIRLPFEKQWFETRIKAFNLRKENEVKNKEEKSVADKIEWLGLRGFFAFPLYYLGKFLILVGRISRELALLINSR